MKQYTTVSGDMWDGIAKKTLGSEYYTIELIEANPEYRETVVFSGNVTLCIPEIEQNTFVKPPPWLQVEDV